MRYKKEKRKKKKKKEEKKSISLETAELKIRLRQCRNCLHDLLVGTLFI